MLAKFDETLEFYTHTVFSVLRFLLTGPLPTRLFGARASTISPVSPTVLTVVPILFAFVAFVITARASSRLYTAATTTKEAVAVFVKIYKVLFVVVKTAHKFSSISVFITQKGYVPPNTIIIFKFTHFGEKINKI